MAAKMGNAYPLTNQAMDLAAVPSRASGNDITPANVPHAGDVETGSLGGSDTKEKFEGPNDNDEVVQDGVKQAKAITATWSRKNLYTAYAFMWMIYAVNAFQSSITGNLAPFITSNFESHSLLPTISIVSNILSAVAYMVLAKVLNLWDRTYGFSVMALFATIGLILSATCTNVYAYSAAQCFYSVGFIGIIFAVDVSTTDTSSLRDRGFAYAFTASPWIICAYAGAKIAERFYENNWRWAYGIFAIILPFVALGYITVFQLAKRKALQVGELKRPEHGRTLWESAKYYLVEFDVIGVFLISAGLSLFLLPFSIAASAADQWRSAHIIVMLVLGVACLIAFGVYERFWSPKPFVPFHLLSDRTIIGSCILQASWQIAYYSWYSYYTSYLMVVYDLSVSHAGYIASIYDVVAGVWLLPIGYAIRRTGRFKWFMWFALPCYALGVGLMIRFRNPGYSVGWMAFCNVLIAFGGSTFTLTEQVAVLAAASHNDAAAALAMLGLFGYFGGAIGNSMCGAIWTHTFPKYLAEYLPEESLPDLDTIYEDLYTQISYPVGDPTRTAIEHAYASTQQNMLIAGCSILALALVSIAFIRNIRVDRIEQVKGVLF